MKIAKISEDLHTAMKAAAAIRGRSLQDCIDEACLMWLEQLKTDRTNAEKGHVLSGDKLEQ